MWSHKSDEWLTPIDFYMSLDDEFHFRMDPCTISDNPLGTEMFYTIEHNGLEQRWVNPTFVNPPYGRGMQHMRWIKKAIDEAGRGVTTVMLLPARTDTKWFHEYIYNKDGIDVRFIRGRLKFRIADTNDQVYRSEDSAPFPSMIVIFRGQKCRRC